jgi:O-antigen/teichoic acid export membrane protein
MKSVSGGGLHSILANGSYIFSGRLLNIIVRGIYILLVARLLGPVVYGLFASTQAWYLAFLPLSTFGMQGIISLELARNKSNTHQLTGSSLTLRFITAFSAGLLSMLSGWLLNADSVSRNLIFLFSIAMLGRSLATWTEDILIAYERAQYSLRLESLFRPMEAIMGSGWLLFANGGIFEIALIHALSWWLQALAGFWLVKKNFVPTLKPIWDSKFMIHMLRMALPLLISGFAINWFLQGPIVLLQHTSLHEQTIGYLALAFQIFSLSCSVPMSLGMAALPVLSRASQRNDGKDILFAETMIKGVLLLAAPVGIASLYIMPVITPWIFGVNYNAAGELLAWTLWLLIPFSIGYLLSQVLIAQKKLKSAGLSVFVGISVFSASYIYFTHMYGVNGSIISCALGMITWVLLSIAIIAFKSKLNIIRTLALPLMGFGLVLYGGFYFGIL